MVIKITSIKDNEIEGELYESEDDLYHTARRLVESEGKASTSFIQRHLQIGYNRAARLVEEMEAQGVISAADATGKRIVYNNTPFLNAELEATVIDIKIDMEHENHIAIGHNSNNAQDYCGIAGKRLLGFVERVERLEGEKAALQEDIKEVYGEAKGVGFDTKIIRMVIKQRKMDKAKRIEQLELFDLYWSAIGES